MHEASPGRQDHRTETGARPLRPLLASAGALLAAGILAAPAQAAFPGDNGTLVYESINLATRSASSLQYWYPSDLFTVSPDGSDEKPFVTAPGPEWAAHDPAVSADGKRVAYVEHFVDPETRTATDRIRVRGLDGSGDHVLLPDEDHVGAPAWSPDGTQLVYVRQGTRYERSATALSSHDTLWVAGADGTGARQIELDGFEGNAANPQWSPDGKWIAFDDSSSVWVVSSAAGPQTPVLVSRNDASANRFPNWAPDGTAIAFTRDPDDSTTSIVEVAFEHGAPGDTETEIASGEFFDRATYSPDGLKIAWAGNTGSQELRSAAENYRVIFVANVDGSNPKALDSENYLVEGPDWAPVVRPKPGPQPQAPGPAVVITTPEGDVAGETAHKCASRRNFVIRLRPRGAKLKVARVIVNGKRVAVKKGGRWTARVDLRTLPKKRFKVDVTVWTADGRRFHEVRRYWTCTPAR